MKKIKIPEFLIQKETILVVVFIIIGLIIGRMCSNRKPDSAQTDLLQQKVDNLHAEYNLLALENANIEKRQLAYKDSLSIKSRQIDFDDSIYRVKERWFSREINRISMLPPVTVTLLLDNRYAGIPTEEIDRHILTDLMTGDACDSLLTDALKRIEFRDSKIAMMENATIDNDVLIKNLKRQVAARNEELKIKNAQLADMEKEAKRYRRQRNVITGFGLVALILGVVF